MKKSIEGITLNEIKDFVAVGDGVASDDAGDWGLENLIGYVHMPYDERGTVREEIDKIPGYMDWLVERVDVLEEAIVNLENDDGCIPKGFWDLILKARKGNQ